MLSYFIRRLLLTIPTFIGVTLIIFSITRIVPGGPVEKAIMEVQQQAAQQGKAGYTLSEDQLNSLKELYGFDKPILEAYWDWFTDILQFNFGESLRYYEPVLNIIIEKFPISLTHGIALFLFSYLISIPLGIVKAIKHNSFLDSFSSLFIFAGYAIPSYIFGLILLIIFGSYLDWFPMGGFVSEDFDAETMSLWEQVKDVAYHNTLPLLAYLSGSFAFATMLMKNSLMDNLSSDYIRTAMAKGSTYNRAVVKHALRNSLIPLASGFGSILTLFLTGSFILESIFNIDGLGLLGWESLIERDYPVVLATLVLSTFGFLLGNILSDLAVAIVDPRVKYS